MKKMFSETDMMVEEETVSPVRPDIDELRQHKSEFEHSVEDRTNHLKSAMEKIRHFSITDNLTGCYNRLYLSENLDREVSRSLRYKRSISLAMFDIDRCKSVNDSYGHQCGDRILVELVNRVTSGTRGKVD